MILLPFIIRQQAHFWSKQTPACSCLQIEHIHSCWCWTKLFVVELLTVFPFSCCCFDLLSAYSHNKTNGIPNAKNIPIVRIGIRKTNKNIPKHNVAKPSAKIQRVVRLCTFTIQAPLLDINHFSRLLFSFWPYFFLYTIHFIFIVIILLSKYKYIHIPVIIESTK